MKKIDDLYWGTGPKDMDDDDEGSISMSEDKIATVNNHMYFYAAVTRAKILEFNRKLRMLDQRLANQACTFIPMEGQCSLPWQQLIPFRIVNVMLSP